MRDNLAKRQTGITLIELLAVMAVISILAAIIIPAVSGTGAAGKAAQGGQDSASVDTAAFDYFSAHSDSKSTLKEAVTLTATINGQTPTSTVQTISNQWPEKFITRSATSTAPASYTLEFPSTVGATTTAVVLTDKNGNNISISILLTKFTAVDIDALSSGFFLQAKPESVDAVSTLAGTSFHALLWLFEKQLSASGHRRQSQGGAVQAALGQPERGHGQVPVDLQANPLNSFVPGSPNTHTKGRLQHGQARVHPFFTPFSPICHPFLTPRITRTGDARLAT